MNEDDTFKALQKWTYRDAFDYSMSVIGKSNALFDDIDADVFDKTGWQFDDLQKKRRENIRRLGSFK